MHREYLLFLEDFLPPFFWRTINDRSVVTRKVVFFFIFLTSYKTKKNMAQDTSADVTDKVGLRAMTCHCCTIYQFCTVSEFLQHCHLVE
ncbi:hypothetical protein EB796_006114 [Bugula neritina]|uniref:Uncharacterized protein n=1 Tax=Bugula neritina TaxID=10212 RepID=A0A7J7KBE3_BUGNE|nr:hypothetical protein EB796_006114 [Bugula neritina]